MLNLFRKKVYIIPLNFTEAFSANLKKSMDECDGTQYTIEALDESKKVTFCSTKKGDKIKWHWRWNFWKF